MISEQKDGHCEKFEALIEDYLSGELPRAKAEQLTAHFDACGNCRKALDDARISARLVSAFEPVPDPGAGSRAWSWPASTWPNAGLKSSARSGVPLRRWRGGWHFRRCWLWHFCSLMEFA